MDLTQFLNTFQPSSLALAEVNLNLGLIPWYNRPAALLKNGSALTQPHNPHTIGITKAAAQYSGVELKYPPSDKKRQG
jgi:hypothetical protein